MKHRLGNKMVVCIVCFCTEPRALALLNPLQNWRGMKHRLGKKMALCIFGFRTEPRGLALLNPPQSWRDETPAWKQDGIFYCLFF